MCMAVSFLHNYFQRIVLHMTPHSYAVFFVLCYSYNYVIGFKFLSKLYNTFIYKLINFLTI